MTTTVLPAIPGLTYPLRRTPLLQNRRPTSVSGMETRIADWSIPRYTWELTYSALRQGVLIGTWAEYAQLQGFFEQMLGSFYSFLYQDADDNAVVGQTILTGDGVTTTFQLVRTFGGATMPVLAPNLGVTPVVKLNGVTQPGGNYSITLWNTVNAAGPGKLIFVSPPGNGVVITADFSYYFPVRFDDDTLTFEKFLSNVYELKKMTFTSLKNDTGQ